MTAGYLPQRTGKKLEPSITVRVHRKMRQAGVEAELQVFEGLSHAQYYRDINAPETIDDNTEVAHFFDKHLGR